LEEIRIGCQPLFQTYVGIKEWVRADTADFGRKQTSAVLEGCFFADAGICNAERNFRDESD